MKTIQAEEAKNKAKEDLAQLRDEAKDVMERIKALGQDAKKVVGDNTMDVLSAFTSEGIQQTHDTVESLEEYIKQKPLCSTLISFGLGLFIAKVIGSWTSSR